MKDLIVVRDYLHKDDDEIPSWIFDDKKLREQYYERDAETGEVGYRLYEVEVEAVFDPNTWKYTVIAFKLGDKVYVEKE